jgi:hypothetical protein
MSDFVAEYSSVFYYLKNTVLLPDFVEKEMNVPMSYDQSTGLYLAQSIQDIDPVDKYRGWLYFDELDNKPIKTAEQSTRVKIYRSGGSQIPSNEYTINYVLGGVEYTGAPGITNEPQTATYYWNYVAVVDHWPTDFMSQVPVVALDILDTTKVGYQFGSGKKNLRMAQFDIFASSAQELRELTEVIYNGFYLKSILCLDYRNSSYGHPLNYDGTFNDRYIDIEEHPDYNGCLFFEDTKATRVGLPVALNDFNRFRSRVTTTVASYEERF